MPINLNRRIRPDVLKTDRTAFMAIEHFSDYVSHNSTCSLAELARLRERMEQAQNNELLTRNAADAARDAAVVAEWEFHSAVTAARQQVLALYGDDSDNVSAIGLKKRSERRRRSGRRSDPSDS